MAIHFASASLSGASVNPARSIGSALIGGDVSALWICLLAPVIDGVLGAIVYRVVAAEDLSRDVVLDS